MLRQRFSPEDLHKSQDLGGNTVVFLFTFNQRIPQCLDSLPIEGGGLDMVAAGFSLRVFCANKSLLQYFGRSKNPAPKTQGVKIKNIISSVCRKESAHKLKTKLIK